MDEPKSIRLLDHQPDAGNEPKRCACKNTDAQADLDCL
jgi:hypothetical protein